MNPKGRMSDGVVSAYLDHEACEVLVQVRAEDEVLVMLDAASAIRLGEMLLDVGYTARRDTQHAQHMRDHGGMGIEDITMALRCIGSGDQEDQPDGDEPGQDLPARVEDFLRRGRKERGQ